MINGNNDEFFKRMETCLKNEKIAVINVCPVK